ncbi:hypothetical protein EGT07_13210 [Herbaspirillum sp. HC18]|nr:hypothetical protein EGT07_13210 [Herbaspirillum sp. HC18]
MHSSKVALYVPPATARSGSERMSAAVHSTEKTNDIGPAPRLASTSEEKPMRSAVSEKPASVTSQWEIVSADKTLNTALARWASIAGWQLVWELPVDYAVEARTVVPGTFEEAVGIVAKSMDSAEIPMKVIFYAGNRVLRIVPKGVE